MPLEYLQRRSKPSHLTWEQWYQFANEKFTEKQKKELEQQKLVAQQQEDQEKMALALTMDFFDSQNLDFTIDSTNGVGTSSMVETLEHENEKKVENATSSTNGALARKVEFKHDLINKSVELSKEIQSCIREIADLFLDPDVIFAMQKLKCVGEHMKGTPKASEFAKEVSNMNALQKSKEEENLAKVKKELDYDDGKRKTMFPSAKQQNFEQFSENLRAPKRKASASPAQSTGMVSPKSTKKQPQTLSLKSMAETKMDIIASGIDVLKKKKLVKFSQSLWTEVSNMNRTILEPIDPGFYSLMSNFFSDLDKLPESAWGTQLKSDLFDYIGSNVEYSRVSFTILRITHL